MRTWIRTEGNIIIFNVRENILNENLIKKIYNENDFPDLTINEFPVWVISTNDKWHFNLNILTYFKRKVDFYNVFSKPHLKNVAKQLFKFVEIVNDLPLSFLEL